MANQFRGDPKSLNLPNTGNLRQPRLFRLGNLLKSPKAAKIGAIKTRAIPLKSLLRTQ